MMFSEAMSSIWVRWRRFSLSSASRTEGSVSAREGAAVRPPQSQTRRSAGCSTGSARTMSAMKVAVMT